MKGPRKGGRRGIPWSKDEHRRFLLGLDYCGKGHWRTIARKFVGTRTPSQVASHAQKFFQRRQKVSMGKTGDKRRASINDITSPLDYTSSFHEHAINAALPRSTAAPRQLPVVIHHDQLSAFEWLHQGQSDGYAVMAGPAEVGKSPSMAHAVRVGDRMVILKF